MNKYLITATIDRRRNYFLVEAKEMSDAIEIFNKHYNDIQFRNIRLLTLLT
jgi:hypothetical protein